MDDLTKLGYRLMFEPIPMSYNETVAALRAMQRHHEFHEVDIRRTVERLLWERTQRTTRL